MNLLYFECNMGAAGDMLTGALYELLEKNEKKEFLSRMNHTGLPGIKIIPAAEQKCGIHGTHMRILVHGAEEREYEASHQQGHTSGHDHTPESLHEHGHAHEYGHAHTPEHTHSHTGYSDILHQISHLDLPEEVREHAAAIYRLIGEAEAKVHETVLEQIHFHEVGTLDALADVVGCCLLIHMLQPDQIMASPVHVGSGTVRCAHGILPVPAPAVAELLKQVPIYGGQIQGELCTPTGAAILKHFASSFGAMPTMEIQKTGYGMGTKDFPQANCVRAFWGRAYEDAKEDIILSLSCNLDDMTGEALGFAAEQLLNRGALDVYTTPIGMKKGRPGQLLTCLCRPQDETAMTELLFRHTTTRGIRIQEFRRHVMSSGFLEQDTPYGKITLKKSEGYRVTRIKPEYEDMARIAREQDMSLEEVSTLLFRPEIGK